MNLLAKVFWTGCTTFPVAVSAEDLAGAAPAGTRDEEALEAMRTLLLDKVRTAYDVKASLEDPESIVQLERYVIIRSIDRHWQDHLTEMEELRRSVGLRGYGQKDPLSELQERGFPIFWRTRRTPVRRSVQVCSAPRPTWNPSRICSLS